MNVLKVGQNLSGSKNKSEIRKKNNILRLVLSKKKKKIRFFNAYSHRWRYFFLVSTKICSNGRSSILSDSD